MSTSLGCELSPYLREMRCFSLSPDNAWKKEKGNGAQPNYKPKARKMNACWICACIFFFEKKATVRKRSGREAHAALLVQMDILVVFVRVDELRHNLRDNLEHALGRRAGLVNCNNTRKRRARQRKGRWAMLTTTATTTTTRATAMMILLHCRKLPQRAKCANLFPCCGVPSLPLLCCFALLLCLFRVCVCAHATRLSFLGAPSCMHYTFIPTRAVSDHFICLLPPTTKMFAAAFAVLLLLGLVSEPVRAGTVWPLPKHMSSTSTVYQLDRSFQFSSSSTSDIFFEAARVKKRTN